MPYRLLNSLQAKSDIAAVAVGYGYAAHTNGPIMTALHGVLLDIPGISPFSQEVAHGLAGVVVAFVSRVLFDTWGKIIRKHKAKKEAAKKATKEATEPPPPTPQEIK